MKKIAATILRIFSQCFGILTLCSFTPVNPAFADNISKPFEFGAGTPQPRSHVRTFPTPCSTAGGIAAVVKFKRLGPAGASNDIPIIIELREPDTAPDQEGPVVETKTATAKKNEQTIILRSQSSNRGCSLPWRVRVRYANEGTPSSQVFGTIRLDYDGGIRDYIEAEFIGDLEKGESRTTKLGDAGGLKQGKIEITANWVHYIGVVQGPNPVKLRFQLLDPNGTIVKTVEAYSSNELRSELPKFKLVYQVSKCGSGQWKLKTTNIDDDNADVQRLNAYFKSACPN